MADQLSKSDILIQDLGDVYQQVATMLNKLKDISVKNAELENELKNTNGEKEILNIKIEELEGEIVRLKEECEKIVKNSLNLEERETLKFKIQDMISRIDNHLSSDR